ncbi:MAG: GyrI-like domain-containing protein, partial [Spirochaetales bacterium]|nr:GyrI-like domain-containing protein [Spirochaetales bacterium]
GDTLFLDITYNDPELTEKGRCLYDLCMVVGPECDRENRRVIRGGLYASYHFEGSIEEISRTYKGLFSIWLPQSKYELCSRIGYDLHRKKGSEKGCLELDIRIPIQ